MKNIEKQDEEDYIKQQRQKLQHEFESEKEKKREFLTKVK